jgi:nicotinamidase/pyrazinamidase
MKKALIIVDAQYDFMPGGSLAVEEGDQIVPIINELIPKFDLIIFTKDWHPSNHKSFASQHEGKNVFDTIDLNGLPQVLWPDHCVQESHGSEIHKDIPINDLTCSFYVIKKGMDTEVDSYSGFYDNGRRNSTGLVELLKEKGVDTVVICGLALDFCVSYTAKDAATEGFKTVVIEDGTRAINQDINEVLLEFKNLNIAFIESYEYEEWEKDQIHGQ